MSDNTLFDIFDQEEPSAVVELPDQTTILPPVTTIT